MLCNIFLNSLNDHKHHFNPSRNQTRTFILEWPRLFNQSQDCSEIGSNCRVLATANHMSCSMLDLRIHLLFYSNQREPPRNRHKMADSADGIGKDVGYFQGLQIKLYLSWKYPQCQLIDYDLMSWIWQRLYRGKLWFLRDSCRQCLLAALSCELAWSRSDSPQPENAYGKSEHLGLAKVVFYFRHAAAFRYHHHADLLRLALNTYSERF